MVPVRMLLQAGGKGTRLRRGIDDPPKPLARAAGIPLIERLITHAGASGIEDISIVIGADGDPIIEHVSSPGLFSESEPPRIDFIREQEPLGNAGILGQLPYAGESILFCFADLYTDLEFARLVSEHRRHAAQTTIASHYQFHRLQLGELTADDDRVLAYVEKPTKRFLICSGIVLFEPAALHRLTGLPPPFGLSDAITHLIGAGMPVSHWLHGANWYDVNTLDTLAEVDRHIESRHGGEQAVEP